LSGVLEGSALHCAKRSYLRVSGVVGELNIAAPSPII
jgi:hypothetical protein